MKKGNWLVMAFALAATLVASMPVGASIVGTEQMVTQQTRAGALNQIEYVLAGEAVEAQLKAWGVAPEAVSERLKALSDVELQQLANRMTTDPAGGVLVAIGVVFVVLVVLDLLGITNIFRRV